MSVRRGSPANATRYDRWPERRAQYWREHHDRRCVRCGARRIMKDDAPLWLAAGAWCVLVLLAIWLHRSLPAIGGTLVVLGCALLARYRKQAASVAIVLHHDNYRMTSGWEMDSELHPLCQPCHRRVHRYHDRHWPKDGFDPRNGRFDQALYQHLETATRRVIRRGRWRWRLVRRLPEWGG